MKRLFVFSLAVIGIAVFWAVSLMGREREPNIKPYITLPLENGILKLVNEERQSMGLKKLKLDTAAKTVAMRKVGEMMEYAYFAHISPVTGSLKEQYDVFGNLVLGDNLSYAGENIARVRRAEQGAITPELLFKSWMDSSAHRNNILNEKYDAMGVAVIYAKGTVLAAQEFIAY